MSVTKSWLVRGSDRRRRPGRQLRGDVGRLGVIHLERLRAHLLKALHGGARFQLLFLAGRDFIARGDPQHVARLAQAQALGLHDDVQRLVPGHILQAQGDRTRHRVGGHDVEVREVGDDLQQRTDFDVLEVQRQLLPGVARALAELVGIHALLAHLQHELVVALVRGMLPVARRRHHHAHAVTRLRGGHRLHRRAEVGHIQAAAQALGQGTLQELHHEARALLADVDTDLVVRQLDDDTPRIARAAAEVDVAQRADVQVAALGKMRRRIGLGRHRFGTLHDHQQAVALDARLERRRLLEVDHHPRAFARLNHGGRTEIAFVDVNGAAPHGIGHARKVQGDARGRLHSEARRRGLQGFGQVDPDHLGTTLNPTGDRLDRRLRLRPAGRQDETENQPPLDHPPPPRRSSGRLFWLFHLASSTSCSAVGRSIHSPDGSCTISRRATSVSVMRVTRPKFCPRYCP